MIDPERVATASEGRLTPATVTSFKVLLAAGVVREFAEPREGRTGPPDALPGPLFSKAQELVARAIGSDDPQRLATVLAALFDQPLDRTERVVQAYLQRDDR